jgi:RNA polymerase sigma-70 factor (ECF subfamily)
MTEEAARLREDELVCRAAGGDAEAFGDLYERYLDSIYRYVFFRVRDEKRAEDLTEQVFISAWEAIERYEPRGYPFSSWLYRIAHNAVIDHYRTDRDEKPLDAVAFTLADESLGPEETLIKKREVLRLLEAIAELSEEKQRLIILRFVDGLSHAQVAQILGKSEGACRVTQHRALAALSEILGRE